MLHPTSLPGRWGIGDIGPTAFRFVDFLSASGNKLWQILPLGPTGLGNSPYQCLSSFAGNPLLISLDVLVEEGLLQTSDLEADGPPPEFPMDHVDYQAVREFKLPVLERSYRRFKSEAPDTHVKAFDEFCEAHQEWLDDYALFMSLKERYGGISWSEWDGEIAGRRPGAVDYWRHRLARRIEIRKYYQYLFFRQWGNLRKHANDQGIQIIGDMPIFVAYDGADVWSNPELFHLDENGRPTAVAGVPPDYFSETGQLWGNPLYRWDRMAANGYAWWIKRLEATLRMVDIVRLDHFRGFEAYWEVPAGEKTAVGGHWVKGPGRKLFHQLEEALGELPVIAEDLGVITPEVEELRDEFERPGMKVLHFAFGDDADNPYLPHNYEYNCVAYTGTHDNDTTLGWFNSIDEGEREWVLRYLGRDGSDICWDMIRLALASVAKMAIFPLQDALRLGSEARMNRPGTTEGNWTWRFREEALNDGLSQGLKTLSSAYGRI